MNYRQQKNAMQNSLKKRTGEEEALQKAIAMASRKSKNELMAEMAYKKVYKQPKPSVSALEHLGEIKTIRQNMLTSREGIAGKEARRLKRLENENIKNSQIVFERKDKIDTSKINESEESIRYNSSCLKREANQTDLKNLREQKVALSLFKHKVDPNKSSLTSADLAPAVYLTTKSTNNSSIRNLLSQIKSSIKKINSRIEDENFSKKFGIPLENNFTTPATHTLNASKNKSYKGQFRALNAGKIIPNQSSRRQ